MLGTFQGPSRPGLICLAVLVVAVTGCGRKGDPIPPPSKVPAAPSDLVAQQQGPEIVLRFTYPSVTEGGLPLTQIESVQVLAYQRSAPELLQAPLLEVPEVESPEPEVAGTDEPVVDEEPAGPEPGPEIVPQAGESVEPSPAEPVAEGEEDAVGDTSGEAADTEFTEEEEEEVEAEPPLPRVDHRTFSALAGVIRELDGGEELDRHVEGSQVVLRLRDIEFRSEPWIHAYAVVVRANGRNSRPSNIAVVSPVAPPPPVTTAEIEGSEEGIRIRWQLLDDESITGYNVYRRSAEDTVFGEPFGTTAPDQAWFVDTSATMDARWVYAVTALGPRGVESDWGNQREIFFRDVYPPPSPTALVAIPDAEGVRLLWRHRPPADHAGYVVTRASAEATETLTETPVTGLEFTDRGAVSGVQYTYHVVALDQRGNASEASEPVTVVAP